MPTPHPLQPQPATKSSPQGILARTPSGHFSLENLLPSQEQFAFANQSYSRIAYVGSWGSGKSVALCLRMLSLLATVDYSRGFMGRLHASDLRQTTQQIWEEVVPPTWIKRKNQNEGVYTLKNNSQCLFGHLHDPVRGRQHLASLNVAYIGLDQAEEVTEADYLKLTSRARYRADIRHSVFLAANPAGHNWIWRRFFKDAEVRRGHPKFGDWEWLFVKGNSLGIAVPSNENDPKQGGYLPADYLDTLRAELPPEYAARYLDCSFEDFEGKVYPKYSMDSVHNLEVIELDPNWSYFVGIDIGGAAPWAVLRIAVDFYGRCVVYDELYKANMSISEVNRWICRDPHWRKATAIIDPENRSVVNEFQFVNPYLAIRPARKSKVANIARVNTYMQMYQIPHISSGLMMPRGTPRLYITTNCANTRREHDERLWKPSLHGESKPDDASVHACDALEYVVEAIYTPQAPEDTSKLVRLAEADAGSAQFWRSIRKKEGSEPKLGQSEIFEATKDEKFADEEEWFEEDVAEGVWGGES